MGPDRIALWPRRSKPVPAAGSSRRASRRSAPRSPSACPASTRWRSGTACATSPIDAIGLRTELSAGFAADGYARTSGRPAPLLLSTGPGALISLAALMEAASAARPRGRDRKPDPERPDRRRPRLSARAPRPEGVLRARRQVGGARRDGRGRSPSSSPRPGAARSRRRAGRSSSRSRSTCSPARRDAPVGRSRRRPAGACASGRRRARRGGKPARLGIGARSSGRAAASSAPAPGTSFASSPSAWALPSPRRTWARARFRTITRSPPARPATTARSRSWSGTPTSSSRSAPSWVPRRPASTRSRLAGRVVHVDADPERIGATYEALGVVGDAKAVLGALAAAPARGAARRRPGPGGFGQRATARSPSAGSCRRSGTRSPATRSPPGT